MPVTQHLIKNATVVNEAQRQHLDVLVKDGRIQKIAGDISASAYPEAQVIDAAGLYLLPGMIDDQVHFREPGLTQKGDLATESRAAVKGGITSFMEMPNVKLATTNRDELEAKYAVAAKKSFGNYAFYFGATNDNIDEIRALKPGAACGVKVFMGASTGNMLVDNQDTLDNIFRDTPGLIATHCEDSPMIVENVRKYREHYGDDIPVSCHPQIRSEAACYASSSMAVELAKKHGSRLHVLHLTTAKELALFEAGPITGKRITAEACVHHLWFSEEDYAEKGNLIKCNPAIKRAADRDAIREAVNNDVIDIIATDHAPHEWEAKQLPYLAAPAGLPLVQHALVSLLEQVNDGIFTLEKIVHKVCHAPALGYGVKERGFIREGYWADLVLVDLDGTTPVNHDTVLYKCGWTPYEGYTFKGKIKATMVSGAWAYNDSDNEVLQTNTARRLEFIV